MFLEKYEVRALLGKGGHAWVYECFDRFLNRAVAVKVIKTLREAGRDLSHRAQAEAQVLAAMTHPNLVRVMDAGVMGGLVYIVMEKLEGRTLRHALMALSRLTVPEALNLAIQIAEGMQIAHDSGVIHRDLKPENIFIEADSHVKVLDFGVAKVLGASPVTTQKDRLQGVALATGVGLLIAANSKDNEREDLLNGLSGMNSCGARADLPSECSRVADLADGAASFRTVAVVSLGAAVGAGVVSYLLWPMSGSSREAAFIAAPSYSPDGHTFGFAASGRF